jgi:hypothetical protein
MNRLPVSRSREQLSCSRKLVVLRLELDRGQPDLLRVGVRLKSQRQDASRGRNVASEPEIVSVEKFNFIL